MSNFTFRSQEPLYLVIVKENNGRQLLQDWAKSSNVQVTIENNKMKIFESRTLHLFQIGWRHGWDNVMIWDYWNRRHLY